MGSAALLSFDQFLKCREQAEASGQNAVHAGDGHTVVRKGNPLILRALHAVEHLPLGEHAPAAVQHKGKLAEILGKARAGAELDGNVRPAVGLQPSGKLHGSNIPALPVVRAALGDENLVAISKMAKRRRTANRRLQKDLAARHEN